MKLSRGFSLNSLPFVKSSQTVTRDDLAASQGNEAPPTRQQNSSRCAHIGGKTPGMRIPSEHVSVTVRRTNPGKKKKWPNAIPSSNSLRDLPPPLKFKRRKYDFDDSTNCTPRKIAKRMNSKDIATHAAMIRSKQNAMMTTSQSSRSSSASQEVPLSPASSLVLSSCHHEGNEPWAESTLQFGSLWDSKQPLFLDFSQSLSNQEKGVSPLPGPSVADNPPPSPPPPPPPSCISELHDPTAAVNDCCTDFVPCPSSPITTSTDPFVTGAHNDAASASVGSSHSPLVFTKEHVIPVRTLKSSGSSFQEQFDPRTLGIQMLFPREE